MELMGFHTNAETCCERSRLDTGEDKDRTLNQTEERAQNILTLSGLARGLPVGRKCVVLSTACFGIMCFLLLTAVLVLYIKLTAAREMQATHFSYLSQKKLELETRVNNLTVEKSQIHGNVDSVNQKKLELEARVNDLTVEKSLIQRNLDSVNQKKLELETRVKSLSEELKRDASKRGWFFMSTEKKSWSESRQYCRDHGGDLVIINTEEKQRFISSLIKERAWIGLTDIQQEGSMKWVDNSPLNGGFWMKGEPNDENDEDCTEILKVSNPVLNNWNDLPCSEKRTGICER